MEEEWRTLARDDRYEVSSHGRIRNRKTGHIRKVARSKNGYDVQKFYRRGVWSTYAVHRLVTEAFIGPIPEGMDVCHNNGQGLDNFVTNLRIDTRSENIADQYRHGRIGRNYNVKAVA